MKLCSRGRWPLSPIWCVAVVALMAALEAHGGAAAEPRHDGSRLLTDGDLVVEIMDPAHAQRYNTGVRFTPLAAVLRVALGDDEFLSNPVDHDPVSEHAGLATEFDLVSQPPGFGDAEVGGGFVKIGVGILKKAKANYAFWETFEAIELAPVEVTWETSKATFRQVCKGAVGYAYELDAVVTAAGNQVVVAWTLRNTGTKPIETSTYAHNFFRLNDAPVGPDYVLSFPYDFAPRNLKDEQTHKGRELWFTATIPEYVNIDVDYPKDYNGANELTVRHAKNGLRIHCLTSVPGARTAVHGTPAHLCPEQFVTIAAEPGKAATWVRTYTFSRDAK